MNDTPEPKYSMLDCLDPIQLGVVYESLMINANDPGLNSPNSQCYLEHAQVVREAIEANCGWEDYEKFNQKTARYLADYDGQMGWRAPAIPRPPNLLEWINEYPKLVEQQYKRGTITEAEFNIALAYVEAVAAVRALVVKHWDN